MHGRTIDVVTGWETVATPAGYEGLRQLADAEFSGAVSTGTTWAFLLNGRVVGVFEGEIAAFEDADTTAYRAVHPSLPLLFAMQEQGGETRANYYTNETSLRDVDGTLESGGFTGYVELSENVLSGDYYVVYHGGKSMSAAFVGSSERLVTGEEAFETAADPEPEPEPEPAAGTESSDPPDAAASEPRAESPVDDSSAPDRLPRADRDPVAAGEPDPTHVDAAPAADAPTGGAAADTPGPLADDEGVDTRPEPEVDRDVGVNSEEGHGVEPGSEMDRDVGVNSEEGHGVEPDPVVGRDPESGSEVDRDVEPGSGVDRDTDLDPEADRGGDPDSKPESDVGTGSEVGATPDTGSRDATDEAGGDGAVDTAAGPGADDPPTRPEPTGGDTTTQPEPMGAAPERDASAGVPGVDTDANPDGRPGGERSGDVGTADDALTDEERWQQARTIPSLDPEESTGGSEKEETGSDPDRTAARERTARMQRQRQRRQAERDREGPGTPRERAASSAAGAGSREGAPDVGTLRDRLSNAKERIDALEAERETLRTEREELIEERDSLRSEQAERASRIDELEAECERLRSEVARLESQLDDDDDDARPSTSMPPDRALSGTNLFVRYDAKGQATLTHAHAGDASRSDVGENLRLEHHTTFETDGVAVDDRPYEQFLRESTEYAFAQWMISELLYEIGETGNRSELAGVFDAIPDIDRVEIRGEVSVETDDGVESRAFDVVFRDRMGDPLFVTDLNTSRDATTEMMVGSLVENTHTVATEAETLAAGLYVTESFYEPGALETVANRTGGGILSRSSKRSFVKLSRKRGYHLCLVEARDGEFHLNVPEL
jgi:FtsZ-binding cell division protein ZapB